MKYLFVIFSLVSPQLAFADYAVCNKVTNEVVEISKSDVSRFDPTIYRVLVIPENSPILRESLNNLKYDIDLKTVVKKSDSDIQTLKDSDSEKSSSDFIVSLQMQLSAVKILKVGATEQWVIDRMTTREVELSQKIVEVKKK